jgi:hypothetical protein
MSNEQLFTAIAKCGTCNKIIGQAENVTEDEKFSTERAAPLNCFCEDKEHNSLSDVNWNLNIEWIKQ